MRMDPATILSAASSRVIQYQGGENGEVVTVYNPSTNSNSIFLALNRDATTAAVTGQVVVAPGQWSPPFILTEKDNRGGINGIAATGDTVVSVLRQSFRNGEELNAVLGGIFGGMLAAQYWVAISGTQIQLAGAFTEARMDTLDRKTAATGLAIGANAIANGIRIGGPVAQAGGNVRIASADGTDWLQIVNGGVAHFLNSVAIFNVSDTESQTRSGASAVLYNGAGSDPRYTLTPTGMVSHTPVAGGAIDDAGEFREYPIVDGSVVAVGDFVMFAKVAGAGNRVRSALVADNAEMLAGYCTSGGTGNTAGTVFARIKTYGAIMATIISGTGGTVDGQFGKPSTTVAEVNRMISVTTQQVGVFCRVLDGSAATVVGDFFITCLTA